MDQIVPVLGHWVWLVAAGALLFLELLAPGVFFVWLAIAAALTGLADMAIDLSWQYEFLLFAVLSVLSVLAGRKLLLGTHRNYSQSPHLNQRMQGHVGKVLVLHEAIAEGHGKVTIDDTVWDIVGPDAPKGARVRVSGVDGLKLRVELA